MHLLAAALTVILLIPLVTCANVDHLTSCLPEGVKLNSEIVETQSSTNAKNNSKTLQSKLIELKARCKHGRLLARNGKEIRIVQLIGCWGNTPEDYQEQLDRQQRELRRLREKYIVIEIPCTGSKTIAGVYVRYALACRDVTKRRS
jgi:hypothetical protein